MDKIREFSWIWIFAVFFLFVHFGCNEGRTINSVGEMAEEAHSMAQDAEFDDSQLRSKISELESRIDDLESKLSY